jgi:hypothetical protein
MKQAVAFLKKSSAKNFFKFLGGRWKNLPWSKRFFGSFFSKKEHSFFNM